MMVEEAKLGCTHGMLVCLDRDHRMAFILGEILELGSEEAADILEIEPAAYRKRLSRSREKMNEFMSGHCGLVNAARPCRCSKQVTHQIPPRLAQSGKGALRHAPFPDPG